MKKLTIILICTAVLLIMLSCKKESASFKIIIMQDKKLESDQFNPLIKFLNKNNFKAELIPAQNYREAAQMFKDGLAEGMFSGSGIAGAFIADDIAVPLVRPVTIEGYSTYWALILAKKGAKPFTKEPAYFKNKKIALCSLASSGDFYYRSIVKAENINSEIIYTPTHNDAIKLLNDGKADIAVVKNRVWESQKNNFANIDVVGQDEDGENPDRCLIISKSVADETAQKLSGILLAMHDDKSDEAKQAMDILGIKAFIKTEKKDFDHTISLIKSAGINSVNDLEVK